MNPTAPRPIALASALLLLAACAANPGLPAPATDAATGTATTPATGAPSAANPIARVPERFMTPSMREYEIDSVAAWAAPDGGTWLIATAKASNQLVVYDGDTGALLRVVGTEGDQPGQFLRPNGIAVHGDLLFVVERDNQRVQMLQLPGFTPAGEFGLGELLNPYGLWLRELAPGELEILVTDSFMADFRTELVPPLEELDGRVKRYRVQLGQGAPRATLLGQFGDTSPAGALRMVESISGDPTHDRLLIAEEDRRVGTTLREYHLDGRYTGRNLPPERFQAQAEGVALWACGDGSGYWITADQSAERTVFHVFDREDLAFRGSFSGDTVSLTDGIWLHPAPTRAFPHGVLYAAHDDQGAGAFDWRDIARALDLRESCPASP